MHRLALRVLLVACCCSTQIAAQEVDIPALKARLADGVLRWGGDAEGGAPFQLRDPEDASRVIGFEVELADLIAERLSERLGAPIKAEFVQYEWVSLSLGLENEDFDMIISGYEVNPERSAVVRFSRPYYIFSQQLAVRADEESIHNVRDCINRPVGTLAGTTSESILTRLGVTDISGFDDNVSPYLDLEMGSVDAVLLDQPIAIYYASTNPNLKLIEPTFSPGEYAVAMRPQDDNLARAVDLAIGDLVRSGQWQQVLRKWRLWNPQQNRLAQGAQMEAELAGLGFAAGGEPDAKLAMEPAQYVDVNIVAVAAASWSFMDYAPLLLRGAGVTVALTFSSMAVAMSIGLIVCLLRLYGPAPIRAAALGYVEFFRGIPLLLVLFFLYFGLAAFGIKLYAVAAAIIGFGLNYAAYEAEIYRSAIGAVPRGQWEAARALGMKDSLAFRRIIFPQAFRTALGPMTNDLVALFKDTSLVSVIAVRELTKEYMILSRSSLKFLELGLLTAALYLAMSVPLGYLSRWLEKRWGEK